MQTLSLAVGAPAGLHFVPSDQIPSTALDQDFVQGAAVPTSAGRASVAALNAPRAAMATDAEISHSRGEAHIGAGPRRTRRRREADPAVSILRPSVLWSAATAPSRNP